MYRAVLSSGLGSHWRREVLRTSLWFVPALEVAAAIALFAGTLAADRAAYHGAFTCRAAPEPSCDRLVQRSFEKLRQSSSGATRPS